MPPCDPWITGADLDCVGSGSASPDEAELYALMASDLLYQWSGRQFSGLGACLSRARPGKPNRCACWPTDRTSHWSGTRWGFGGCRGHGRILLAGYPVTSIVEVTVDGETLAPSIYRLERHSELVRQDGKLWPSCQNFYLALSDPGTFGVTYRHGAAVPQAGIVAAKVLACELLKAGNGQTCRLPSGVTRVVRQGVTYEKVLQAFSGGKVTTGLTLVDAFVGTYNPSGLRRRSAVWSPDVNYARRV